MQRSITDSDMIILNSVESYLTNLHHGNVPRSPQENLIITQQARDYLYSDIVQRIPRVAAYILAADLETDTIAQGLLLSLSKHAMDPVFIDILMQYLAKTNNAEDNGLVGAFLAKILNKYIEQNWKDTTATTKGKKGEPVEPTTEKNNMAQVEHLQRAVNNLLGNIATLIATRCGNVTHTESLAIAACIAMNNNDTISEIISSDLPVTATLFDIVADPSNLIRAALMMEKSAFTKLTSNQSTFIESLRRWVYDKLNTIPTQTSYQFLVAVYGSVKPEVSSKLIQIKDCGTNYSNLLVVAKQLINQ